MGAGKSLVCRYLEELGCKVLYADDIAKELYFKNHHLAKALGEKFGNRILTGNQISIPKLRQFTFKNLRRQREVNRIVHPFVISEILRKVSRSSGKFVFVEAALIFESGFDKYLDYTILVHSNVRTRVKRIMKRSQISNAEIRSIMKMQMPENQKMRRADFIIQNNGTKSELRRKVRNMFKTLVHDGHSCLSSFV